jgi:hypothetical protein
LLGHSSALIEAKLLAVWKANCRKYHDTRNIGVIGIALFNEAGTNPWTWKRIAVPFPCESLPGAIRYPAVVRHLERSG